MQFQIRFSGNSRPEFGSQELDEIFTKSLDRFQPWLKQVYVYIEDVNGPRGGVDKQCRCVLHLRRMPPIIIRDEDESLFALINRIANRAVFVLNEKMDRKNKRVLKTRGKKRTLTLEQDPYMGEEFENIRETTNPPPLKPAIASPDS